MDKSQKILLKVFSALAQFATFKSIQVHHRNKLREEFQTFKALTKSQVALSHYLL